MKEWVRSMFSFAFLFGHALTLPILPITSSLLAAFAVGLLSGENPIVQYSLIYTAFAAPVAMTLMLAKPIYIVDRIVDTAKLPPVPAMIFDFIYQLQGRSIQLYDTWYTPAIRMTYGCLCLLSVLVALYLSQRVFDMEVVAIISANAVFIVAILSILCLVNWLVSRRVRAESP